MLVIPFFPSSFPAVPIRARTEGPVIQRTSRANSYACVPQVSLAKYVKKVTFLLMSRISNGFKCKIVRRYFNAPETV